MHLSRTIGRGFRALGGLVIPFALLTVEAQAINRYTSTSMTCAGVTSTINREGAAIMRYTSPRSGALLYDQYVRNRASCQLNETLERSYIPTSDLPACPVNRCKEIEFVEYR